MALKGGGNLFLLLSLFVLPVSAQVVTDGRCYNEWKECVKREVTQQGSPLICDLLFYVFGKCADTLTCEDDIVTEFTNLMREFEGGNTIS